MKKVLIAISICAWIAFSCNQTVQKNGNNISATVDTATMRNEIGKSEEQLFAYLHESKISDAFAMHIDYPGYKNIRNGEMRTFAKMDTVLKNNLAKGIKAYDYQISYRDFMVIDGTNVLETLLAKRTVVSDTVKMQSSMDDAMSILWKKANGKWSIAYLHSSSKVN